jgi:hypothetical protein
MNVVCPACGKQHRVNEQMAGKRAKCKCGEVLTIPSVPAPQPAAVEPSNDAWTAPAGTSPASGSATQSGDGEILFQCHYGLVRRSMWYLFGANFVIALILIPVGIFWNEGWSVARTPIPPWAATLLFEIVGFGLLLLVAYMLAGRFLHRDRPQRVAVTTAGVILPKNKVSSAEHFLPWAEVRVKLIGGPVENLDFKRGRLRTIRLVSIQFPTDEDFETFLGYLRERDKL